MDPRHLLYIGRTDVARLTPSLRRTMAWVEDALSERTRERPLALPSSELRVDTACAIRAVPAYAQRAGALGVAVNAGYGPVGAGALATGGLLVLCDATDAAPLCVMDATWIAALRAGASAAVAARYLAKSDSATVGVVGCGLAARKALEGIARVFPLRLARVFDERPDVAERFADELEAALGVEVNTEPRLEGVVRDMDVVVTARPIQRPARSLIPMGWLAPGGMACALDMDATWQVQALRQMDRCVADDRGQVAAARAGGFFDDDGLAFADLGEVVAGHDGGRASDQQRLCCVVFGLTELDVMVARRVYLKALERGVGTVLSR